MEPGLADLAGLFDEGRHDLGVVYWGGGVGHRDHVGIATSGSGSKASLEVFFYLLSWFAQMGVRIEKARAEDKPACVEGALGISTVQRQDLAFTN